MKKIKVAIPLIKNSNWIGGYNYKINLLEALSQLPQPKIEIYLLSPNSLKIELSPKFKEFKFINNSILSPFGFFYWTTKFIGKYLDKYTLHQLFLKFSGFSVLAYSDPLGKKNLISSISWIPDFQHVFLPGFFSKEEINKRNKLFNQYIKCSNIILVSSNSAKNDLKKFSSNEVKNVRVLKFVSTKSSKFKPINFTKLQKKYKLPNLYFHLPNQFWIHKNHLIVAKAIKILNEKNINVNIICTGSNSDYRNPNFFKDFLNILKRYNISNQFKILGIIPYEEVINIMNYSIAVINPSFFEGWSTTVEESKSLNKLILLSDIPVHREQKPQKGIFFNPSDPYQLANYMEKCLKEHPIESINSSKKFFLNLNKKQVLEFANNFQNIVLEAANYC